jgi:hypothetical protein
LLTMPRMLPCTGPGITVMSVYSWGKIYNHMQL